MEPTQPGQLGNLVVRADVQSELADPMLELHDGNGALLISNDSWNRGQRSGTASAGLAPLDDRDPAILATLVPGNYTSVIRGANGTTGIALAEAYKLD